MKTKKWMIFLFIFIVAIAGVYLYQANYYRSHFLPNTKANSISLKNKTVTEASTALTDAFNSENFTIKDQTSTWKSVPKKDIGVKNEYKSSLTKQLSQQNPWLWFVAYFGKSNTITIRDTSLNQEALTSFLDKLKPDLEKVNADRTLTANAKIEKKESGFVITPEVNGNNIDVTKALDAIKSAIQKGAETIDLNNYVVKPTVTSNSSEIKAALAKIQKLATIQATYSISGKTFTIPKETIESWLQYDGKEITLDKSGVKSYVEQLGATYNTSTVATSFKSTKRGEVSVPAGTYSWTIQTDDETQALTKAILAGENFTRSPITQGSASPGSPLIGSTYIEVDLSSQHMWYYKEGKLQIETDIVSGKPSTPTPQGVFYVWNKERNATLKGENYATPVDYWMPIDWSGVGIHDSPWQAAYGGTRYTTNGSHGCVNTPPDVMAKLFDAVSVGTPVIVF